MASFGSLSALGLHAKEGARNLRTLPRPHGARFPARIRARARAQSDSTVPRERIYSRSLPRGRDSRPASKQVISGPRRLKPFKVTKEKREESAGEGEGGGEAKEGRRCINPIAFRFVSFCFFLPRSIVAVAALFSARIIKEKAQCGRDIGSITRETHGARARARDYARGIHGTRAERES